MILSRYNLGDFSLALGETDRNDVIPTLRQAQVDVITK